MNALKMKTSTRLTIGGLLKVLKETGFIQDAGNKFYQTQLARGAGWHNVSFKSDVKFFAFRFAADVGEMDLEKERFINKWDRIFNSYLDLFTVSYDGPCYERNPFVGKSIIDPSIQDKHVIVEISVPTVLKNYNYINTEGRLFDKGVDALIKTWTCIGDLGADEKLVRWALHHCFAIDCNKYPVVTEEALTAAIEVYRRTMKSIENLYFDPKLMEFVNRIKEMKEKEPEKFVTVVRGNQLFDYTRKLWGREGKIHEFPEIFNDEVLAMCYKYFSVLLQKFTIRYEAMKNKYVVE